MSLDVQGVAGVVAFHGDPAIQAKYLARVKAHREADELVKGATGDGGKGCAVWCTFDAYEHYRGPSEVGIPAELFGLNDFIFENLPQAEAMAWPERFLAAPKVGADLRLVRDQFTLWLLTEELAPLRSQHCEAMGGWFRRLVNGENPSREEGEKIARAAWAAWAAWDARDAWAARAAWAAWDARDAWAARAAWAAWAAWDARDAEEKKSIQRMADALIRLMSEAPVPAHAPPSIQERGRL